MSEIDQRYWYKNQRFSPYEEGVLRLAFQARYSDRAIGRMLGRAECTILRHRKLLHLMKNRRRRVCATAIVCCCLIGISAAAHDGDDQLSAWYRSLKDPDTGISCCSMQRDCQTVDDYRASAIPGGYVVSIEGRSVEVPPNKVLQRTDNPTGRAVVCIGHVDGVPVPRCMVRAIEG